MSKIYKSFTNHTKVKNLLDWSKSYALPGFGGVPIYTILSFLYNEFMNDRLLTRANSIAFNLMLALFPTFIFVLTLLPYLPFADNYSTLMMDSLANVMPEVPHAYLNQVVSSITERRNGGLLSIGFILAIIFASNGMLSFIAAFNKKNKIYYKRRTHLKQRLVALLLTLSIGLLFMLSLIIIVIGNRFFLWLNLEEKLPTITQYGILIGKWAATFILVYAGVTILYRYAPKLRKRISLINPGSVMATVLSLVSSIVFSYIVNEFTRYNELYGSFATLIITMIWLQINAFIILAGYELNASIALNQDPVEYSKEVANKP